MRVHTSLEVEVEVFSEAIETGERKLTSQAYLTFVSLDRPASRKVPPLLIETPEDEERCRRGARRRAERLAKDKARRAVSSIPALIPDPSIR